MICLLFLQLLLSFVNDDDDDDDDAVVVVVVVAAVVVTVNAVVTPLFLMLSTLMIPVRILTSQYKSDQV